MTSNYLDVTMLESILISLGYFTSFIAFFMPWIILLLMFCFSEEFFQKFQNFFMNTSPLKCMMTIFCIASLGTILMFLFAKEVHLKYLVPEVHEIKGTVVVSEIVKKYPISDLKNITDGFFFNKNQKGYLNLPKEIKFKYLCNDIVEEYIVEAQQYPQSFFEKNNNRITLPGKYVLHKFFLFPNYREETSLNETEISPQKRFYLKDCNNLKKYVKYISTKE